MNIRRAILAFFVLIAIVAAFIGVTGRITHAQNQGASDSTVMAKLDEVLAAQKAMAETLSSIKEDLRIIQVRVTQSQ